MLKPLKYLSSTFKFLLCFNFCCLFPQLSLADDVDSEVKIIKNQYVVEIPFRTSAEKIDQLLDTVENNGLVISEKLGPVGRAYVIEDDIVAFAKSYGIELPLEIAEYNGNNYFCGELIKRGAR